VLKVMLTDLGLSSEGIVDKAMLVRKVMAARTLQKTQQQQREAKPDATSTTRSYTTTSTSTSRTDNSNAASLLLVDNGRY